MPPPLQATRILVVRYRFIGDTILTVPFLRNLRLAYPQALIDVLVGPKSGEVLENCPYINDLIVFDTTRFHKYDSGEGKTKSFWHYARLLRQRRYDMVFVLKRSWSSAILALLTGARYRIGYASNGRELLLTHSTPFDKDVHEVDSTLSVLQCARIEIVNKRLEAWVSDEEDATIKKMVPEAVSSKPRILIHAAAAHPDKVYPLERWAQVIGELKEKLDFIPFFTGDKQDEALYQTLEVLSGVKGVNMAGKLSLRQSMALYKLMDLSICVDSGPAHLSAAVGTPTIALFGPTDPNRWRPYGDAHRALFDETLPCRPCHYRKTCSDRECLTAFDPQRIVKEALELYKLGIKAGTEP